VSFTSVWVSDLALVHRLVHAVGEVEGFVLRATTGEPVKGALAQLWVYRDGAREWEKVQTVLTDKNGMYHFTPRLRTEHLVLATFDGHQIATAPNSYPSDGRDNPPGPYEHTVFFTDRSVYRSGQTIHFKGICLSVDQEHGSYRALAGREVTVEFVDPNNKEIARRIARTNDYGSFAGSFPNPRDRLTGRMTLRVDNGPRGETQVSVEEYKRPKFRVTVEAPRGPAGLNAEVKVSGKATSYTGAPIGGVKVDYRVVREARGPAGFDDFHPWWLAPQPEQEVAHWHPDHRGRRVVHHPVRGQARSQDTEDRGYGFPLHRHSRCDRFHR
jgi:uncharacterized protein YfaS (alpha-2-macroglobulin family)